MVGAEGSSERGECGRCPWPRRASTTMSRRPREPVGRWGEGRGERGEGRDGGRGVWVTEMGEDYEYLDARAPYTSRSGPPGAEKKKYSGPGTRGRERGTRGEGETGRKGGKRLGYQVGVALGSRLSSLSVPPQRS